MTGREIAEALDVEEPTVRQYVRRFRRFLAAEHKRLGKPVPGNQDIILNTRNWQGYFLNLDKCHIRRK
jgi:hypothetical protein